MKLFIFGAGASRGSSNLNVDANKMQSPLANELLDVIYKDYAKELGLDFTFLRTLFAEKPSDQSLEEWLTTQWRQANHGGGTMTSEATSALRIDLGKFTHYLRWMFQTISLLPRNRGLYVDLLVKLRKESYKGVSHGFISFNYDTLFDIAFSEIWGGTLSNVGSYVTNNIFKPHGSINWFAQKRPGDRGIEGTHHDVDWRLRYSVAAENLFTGTPLNQSDRRAFDPRNEFLTRKESVRSDDFAWNYFQPMIFLPLSEKMFEHIPELSKEIEEGASKILPKVGELYLIGYQAKDRLIHEWIDKYLNGRVILNVVSNTEEGASEIMERMLGGKYSKSVLTRGKVFFDNTDTTFKNGFRVFVENYNK